MAETANHRLKFLRPAIGLRWRSTVFMTQTVNVVWKPSAMKIPSFDGDIINNNAEKTSFQD